MWLAFVTSALSLIGEPFSLILRKTVRDFRMGGYRCRSNSVNLLPSVVDLAVFRDSHHLFCTCISMIHTGDRIVICNLFLSQVLLIPVFHDPYIPETAFPKLRQLVVELDSIR